MFTFNNTVKPAAMPIIQVTLIQGYDDQTRIELCQRLTDAARTTIAAPLDGITVYINEVQSTSYMRGGVARVPGASKLASPVLSAESVVTSYLAAMQDRDLDLAKSHLATDFSMRFPGGNEFSALGDMIAWASTRYCSVSKDIEQIDVCSGKDQSSGKPGSVVYCSGTLFGSWLDGTEFSGIRFIDRFVFDGDKIRLQDVWNDIAEYQPATDGATYRPAS